MANECLPRVTGLFSRNHGVDNHTKKYNYNHEKDKSILLISLYENKDTKV